jgi:hypothetical protein
MLELPKTNKLTRIEYHYSRSTGPVGPWRHAGDYGPGKNDVYLRRRDMPPDLIPGEHVRVDFRTFDGVSYSADWASADIVVNRPPTITRDSGDTSPITIEAGKPLTLPFSIADEDGDALTVLYRIDDDVTWSVVPSSSAPNVVPANLVSRALSAPGAHTLQVTAFDGLEDSVSPLQYELIRSANRWFDFDCQPDRRRNFKLRVADFTPCTMRYSIDGKAWSEPTQFYKGVRGVNFRIPDDVWNKLPSGQHELEFSFVPEVTGQAFVTPRYWFQVPNAI